MSGLESFMTGGDAMYGGANLLESLQANLHMILIIFAIYAIAVLWRNWDSVKQFHWNPLTAKPEGMCGNVWGPYKSNIVNQGSRMGMYDGDQVGTGQALRPDDDEETTAIRKGVAHGHEGLTVNDLGREGMWTGGREGMWAGGNDAPSFWEGNPYLTQAKHWGIPDLSSKYDNSTPIERVYWGTTKKQVEGLTPNQQWQALNG